MTYRFRELQILHLLYLLETSMQNNLLVLAKCWLLDVEGAGATPLQT